MNAAAAWRVLLIDDDRDVLSVTRMELESAGFSVMIAANGAEGLALQRTFLADLVVTDIFMPEKEGIETIRDLKEQFPFLKIIAISGGGRRGDLRPFSARDLGIVAGQLDVVTVLQKPFQFNELLSAVESALGDRGQGPRTRPA